MNLKNFIALSLIPFSMSVLASDYVCTTMGGYAIGTEGASPYSSVWLSKYQPKVLVLEKTDGITLSRCSYSPSAKKETCDSYRVDVVKVDAYVGHRKFYVFGSQFDVQIFSNNSFIENNGRGGVAYGQCALLD